MKSINSRTSLTQLARKILGYAVVAAFAAIVALLAPGAQAVTGSCESLPGGPIEVEGPGGSSPQPTGYATLSAAFAAINAGGHTGPAIVVDVCGDTTEPAGGAILNASGGASSYSTILVNPVGGLPRTISGTATAGLPLVDLVGADGVTIDGLGTSNNSLTISNLSTSATPGTATIRFVNGATGNTITNASILGSSTMAVSANGGTIYFATDASTASGNDNNTISNNTIGPAGANLPTKGILCNGTATTAAIGNSGLIINNNNIFDYFGASVTSSGIAVNGGCNTFSITNNRFYQTGTRTWTVGSGGTHRAIDLNSATATTGVQGMTVTGNIIGFASNTQTGTYTLTGGTTGKFQGIAFNGITGGTVSNINSNTIASVSMTGVLSSGTGSVSSPFSAILINNGLANSNTNIIGSQGATGSLTFSTTTTTGSDFYGIYNFSVDDWTANGNDIGGISITNLGASGTMQFYGLRANTSSAKVFSATSNNVGGTVANSIQLTSTGTSSQVLGMVTSLAIATNTSNTVRNLTNNNGTGTTTGASVIGMVYATATPNHTVSQNTVFNLSNTHATAATVVTGIQFTGSTANVVDRNRIYGLTTSTTSATAEVNGIRVAGGTTIYRNNMIAIGAGIANAIGAVASNAGATGINGINEVAGTDSYFHNSVYIGGSPTAGTGASYAFNGTVTTNTRSFRDNIFYNARSNSGATGKNYAIKINGTAPNPTGLTINNNLYRVDGTGGVFGFYNSLDVANLSPGWKTAVGQDAASFESNPQYNDPTNATPDLHIHPTNATVAEGNGVDVGVVNDFDGQTRASLTPVDIGADAGNFNGIDLAPPVITYTALGNTSLTTNRVLTVTMMDVTGVATGGFAPRIYFNKNGGGYFFTVCSLSSGTVQNGSWSCTIDNSLLSGVVATDVVRYFVVAQDTNGNLASNPSAGFAGTDVTNVTSPPTTPSQYTIVAAFSGSYNVGAGQTFTSLTNAGGIFAAINAGALTGNVTINITSDLSATSGTLVAELGTNALNQWAEDGVGGYTMLIKPSGAPRQIIGTNTGALIRLNDADRVTIDGSTAAVPLGVGGDPALRELTIQNTNTGTSAVVISVGSAVNGAQNNTLRNLNVLGQDPTTTLAVIAMGGTTPGSVGTDNDNNRVENCSIKRAHYGIYSAGASAANPNIGTVITANESSATTGDRIRRIGIVVFNDTGTQITLNSLNGISTNESFDAVGIGVGAQALDTTTTASGGVTNALVARNKINGVASLSTVGFSAAGIAVAGATGAANTIVNNMITGVTAPATSPDIPAGIFVAGVPSVTTKLFDNSVSMTGDRGAAAFTGMPSFGLAVTGTNPTLELKDNIFYTSQTASGGGVNAKSYAIGMVTTTFTNLDSNYNDFWSIGANDGGFRSGSLEAAAGTSYANLSGVGSWQAAVSDDANSFEVDPQFVSPINDLHLSTAGGASAIENAGVVISFAVNAVTDDFDGDTRAATPDIGADEVRCHAVIPAEACVDGNPCTLDQCFPATGCSNPAGNANAICLPGTGVCDPDDLCTGASPVCPPTFASNSTTCGDAEGVCTNQDYCNGSGACQDNGFKTVGTVCLAGSGVCDPDDTCNGLDGSCAAVIASNTTPCGDAEGVCTNQDYCDGSGACQDNGFKTIGTICLAGTGVCDPDDTCNGLDGSCAAVVAPNTTTCGDAEGVCTNQDYCDGSGACQDNGFKTAGTVCLAGTGVCDPDDTCNGLDGSCAAVIAPNTTTCGDAEGVCTNQDYCDGSGACQDNGFKTAGTVCLTGTGVCDPDDTCNGTDGSCAAIYAPEFTACGDPDPLDCNAPDSCDAGGNCIARVRSSSFTCRPSAGSCDVTEFCNGVSPTCPPDALEPSSHVCRPATNPCDVAESCTGSSPTCPADLGGGPVNVTATGGTPGPTAYTNLGAAFAAINAGTHQAAVTVDICASVSEGATPATLNSNGAGSALYSSVLVRPVAPLVTVSGAPASGLGVVQLNGADGVTIDGDDPNTAGINRDLTIANTAAATTTFNSVVRVALSTLVTTANGDTVKNCILSGSATGRNVGAATSTVGSENTTYGILVGGGASTAAATTAPSPITSVTTVVGSPITATGFTADNNQIDAVARGIAVQGSATTVATGLTISNNVIGNAVLDNPTTVYARGITIQGFDSTSIKGNTIRNMAYFVGTQQMGIALGADGSTAGINAVIDANVVSGVKNNALGTFGAYGINLNAGNTNTVKNNFVSGVTGDISGGAAFSTTFGLFGIRVATGSGHKVYHNSVNMTGLRTGTPTQTLLLSAAFGIVSATVNTGCDVRNNIFANTQSGGASSLAYVSVYLPPSGVAGTFNLTWNNNAYYSGSTVGSQGIAHVGTTYTAIPAGPPTYAGLYTAGNFIPSATSPNSNFRAYTTTLSAANTNDNASFATTAAAPFFTSSNLHINTGLTPTVLESTGAGVGVLLDIDGDTRPGPLGSTNGGATAADLGADEFDGVPLQANDMQATAFIDPTSGSTKPAGGLFSPQASFTNNGTATQMNVTVRYRILDAGSPVYNDPQVIASIAPFATTTVTFAPTSLPAGAYDIFARSELGGDQTPGNDEISGTLIVETPLCGNYNVGSGGDFASLTNTGGAFEKLNGVGASCDVIFSVISDLAGETGTVAQNQWLEVGAGGYTLTIRPSGGPRQIVGSNIGALIRLNGADRVTIEGSTTGATATGVGGSAAIRELTIQNTNTGTSAVVISFGSGPNGAQNNRIRNVIVLGQDPTTTLIGISLGGTTPGTAGTDNDNNRVENSQVGRAIYGIYAVGASAANPNTGTVITMNETSAVPADRVRRVGMLLFNDNGAQVTLNSINGVSTNEGADGIGIGLGNQAIDTTTVASGAITNAFVARNRINGVGSISTTGFSAAGITISGAAGGANTIVNNMITGVTAPATSPDIVAGIYIVGAAGSSTRVYDNSVSMTGDRSFVGTSASQLPSFGIAVTGTNPTLELKNNIFYTTQIATGGGVNAKSYAIGMVTTTFTNLDSNINDFWSTGANDGGFRSGSLAAAAGTDYANLGPGPGTWQNAVSDDLGSFEVNPVFVNPTNNLHLDTSGPATAIENAGLFLAAVPNDYDGDLRHPSTPDIGADEVRCHAAIPAETCNDGNACTVDSCDPATGCQPSVPGNAGATCRPAATACDLAETCDGTSALCPADDVAPIGTLCLAGTLPCDPDDTCNGINTVCAPNYAPNSTTCGDAEGVCTNQDYCNGSGACADGGFKAPGTVCLPGTGTCDPDDTCNGTDGSCAPFYAPSSTLCVGGTSTGSECDDDTADHCSGNSPACVDGFQPDTVPCTTGVSTGGDCDGADHCSGGSTACVDGYKPSTYECRASTVTCDPAEFCTGSSGACPANLVNQSPAVGPTLELSHNKVSGNTTIAWTEAEPGPFNVYRGAIRPAIPFTYNQTCYDLGIPGPSYDMLTPAPGWVFFYLVTRVESPCPESSLGQDSDGAERPNTLACPAAPPDTDGDGFQNNLDNCPTNYNPSQNDSDLDGVGDACDNCIFVPNPTQSNIDGDAYGDDCDANIDGDLYPNGADNCPYVQNDDQDDTDHDGIGDACDKTPGLRR